VSARPRKGMSLRMWAKRDMMAVGVAKGPPGICIEDAEEWGQ